MKCNKVIQILFLSTVAQGCATTENKFPGEHSPETGKAKLYVYREDAFTMSLRTLSVELNQQKIVELDSCTYTDLEVVPGQYEVKAYIKPDPVWGGSDFIETPNVLSVSVSRGGIYYFGYYPSGMAWAQTSDKIFVESSEVTDDVFRGAVFKFNNKFGVVNRDVALKDISGCQYRAPAEMK